MISLAELLLDERFHALDALLGHRTLLEILGIDRIERHHQSLLAWLLDPTAEHGLGTRGLESFVRLIMRTGRTEAQWGPLELTQLDLGLATVTQEHAVTGELNGRAWAGRLDILVEVPLPGTDLMHPLLVIETKIDSDQTEAQTQRYAAWASRHRKGPDAPGDDLRREPLLCYLAPTGSRWPLAHGFHHLSWTDAARWLGGLVPHAHVERTRFVVEDWRRALTQRDDVEDTTQVTVARQLEADHGAVLEALRTRSLPLPASAERRYRRAWHFLGIRSGTRGARTLGDSSFVLALRARFQDALPDRWWHKGASGSLATESRSFREAVEDILPGQGCRLRLKFWCDRPKKGRANLALEFTGGPRGWENDRAREVRLALKTDLAVVMQGIPGSESSGGTNIAVRMPFHVPAIQVLEDDTDDVLDQLDEAFELAAAFAVEVDRRLENWIVERLPTSLPEAIRAAQ